MEIIRQTHPLDEFSRCSLPFFSEDSFFFDIETTGFLAQNSQLYMIGYGFIDNENLTIIQLFAESKNDEKNLIDTFFQFCENYTYMYSYNGDGFDVPYLKEKADMFHLPFKMKELISFDLLKQLRPFKNIFKLSHMKQRDMECFIGLQREDTYDGGQLIEVYKKYLINPSPDAKNNLLQHNYEDLTGLYQLISLKSFLLVFQCNFEFLSCRIEESINYSGITEKFLILTAEIPNAVPNAISYQVNDYYLTIYNKKLVISSKITNNEIKIPYLNYKDYYYLPNEDIAVLKELASGIDKDSKVLANLNNCYGKFQLTEESLQSKELFQEYMEILLNYFLKQ